MQIFVRGKVPLRWILAHAWADGRRAIKDENVIIMYVRHRKAAALLILHTVENVRLRIHRSGANHWHWCPVPHCTFVFWLGGPTGNFPHYELSVTIVKL